MFQFFGKVFAVGEIVLEISYNELTRSVLFFQFSLFAAARITEDTVKLDNIEFDITKIPDDPPKKGGPCCQDPAQNMKQ